jgi:hypothetical protein
MTSPSEEKALHREWLEILKDNKKRDAQIKVDIKELCEDEKYNLQEYYQSVYELSTDFSEDYLFHRNPFFSKLYTKEWVDNRLEIEKFMGMMGEHPNDVVEIIFKTKDKKRASIKAIQLTNKIMDVLNGSNKRGGLLWLIDLIYYRRKPKKVPPAAGSYLLWRYCWNMMDYLQSSKLSQQRIYEFIADVLYYTTYNEYKPPSNNPKHKSSKGKSDYIPVSNVKRFIASHDMHLKEKLSLRKFKP